MPPDCIGRVGRARSTQKQGIPANSRRLVFGAPGAAAFLFACAVAQPAAGGPIRDQEIAECRPGESVTWGDGRDQQAISKAIRLVYRHQDAPPWFDSRLVESQLRRAGEAWSRCGIPVTLVAAGEADLGRADTVLVDWSEAGSRGNFGLANVTLRTLSLGAGAFDLLRTRNPAHDATQTLQMVISHEMGHFFGLLAHSRRCVDVLSYYHDGKGGRCLTREPAGVGPGVEYRHVLPTACDIERCRAANRIPPANPN